MMISTKPRSRKMKPITLEQAKKLRVGDILYHRDARTADNTPVRWRVTGLVKTWKTMPDRVRIPVKHGLYSYGYIDEADLQDFCLEEEVPSWLR
jgi:hypothetical protein